MSGKTSEAPQRPRPWLHAFLILICGVLLYPIFWVVALAFSGQQTVALADLPAEPGFWDHIRAATPLPERWSLDNFTGVLTQQPFLSWMWNSLIVAGLTTFVGVALSCTAAYAFSRFRFPGRAQGMMLFLVTQMFPGTLMLVPLYIIVAGWLGLSNSFFGLIIIYSVTAIPFCVWMLKGYFDTIPVEIEESALMDGCSPARIFLTIVLPLAQPAIAVTALFSFMTAWNEFILAATFLEEESRYTGPIGLRFFVSEFTSQWGYFAAGSLLMAIPVVILFLSLQRFLVSGLTAGGVKS
jgi:arabinogalactan oligomer/maltooligosaccharide transport system permease protein